MGEQNRQDKPLAEQQKQDKALSKQQKESTALADNKQKFLKDNCYSLVDSMSYIDKDFQNIPFQERCAHINYDITIPGKTKTCSWRQKQTVKTTCYGGMNDTGYGNCSVKLGNGQFYFSELSSVQGDFKALGGLPSQTQVRIHHNGKQVTATKQDVGTDRNIQMNIHFNTYKKLGLECHGAKDLDFEIYDCQICDA